MSENKEQPAKQETPQFIQRRILFVKKDLQYRLLALVVLIVVLGISIMTYEFVSAMNSFFAANPSLLQPFYSRLVPISLNIGLKVIIYILLVALVAAVLSHKTAGPVYKIEKTCKEIAESGDLSKRVYLRKGDLFTELKDEFNKMMDALEAKFKK